MLILVIVVVSEANFALLFTIESYLKAREVESVCGELLQGEFGKG
jgi:hypothetical protein